MKIYSLSAQPTSWKQTIPGTKHNREAEFTNTRAKEVMYLPAFTVWVVCFGSKLFFALCTNFQYTLQYSKDVGDFWVRLSDHVSFGMLVCILPAFPICTASLVSLPCSTDFSFLVTLTFFAGFASSFSSDSAASSLFSGWISRAMPSWVLAGGEGW